MSRFILIAVAATAVVITVLASLMLLHEPSRSAFRYALSKASGGYTVEERIALHGEDVAARLKPAFAAASVAYPPHEVAYVAFKDERTLEVHARGDSRQSWRFVKRYPVLAASGKPGPKLMEGDYQVPEGVYRAELLNPNSRFHLSIRLDYPNAFDRQMAQRDGRTRLGGDIMIHGSAVSIGCLAIGDEAAEDLFILSALVTKERTRIVVSPTDFRRADAVVPHHGSPWVGTLYENLKNELKQYRLQAGATAY